MRTTIFFLLLILVTYFQSIDAMNSAFSKRTRIVILDDEPIVAQFAADVFFELGFECVNFFSCSKDYVRHLREKRVDLCLIDVNLQNADGLVLLGWSKAKQNNAKIIMFSGETKKHTIKEAQVLGAEGFLSKMELDKNLRRFLDKWDINYPLW